MSQQSEALKKRAAEFARRIVVLCNEIPPTVAGNRIRGQLIDSATSTSQNYRGACRARSRAEFTAQIGTVAEEADESVGWLELLVTTKLLTAERVRWELGSEALPQTGEDGAASLPMLVLPRSAGRGHLLRPSKSCFIRRLSA